MRRLKFLLLNEKGQTAVEYMLLLVVAMTIGMAFKKKMEEFILNNPNSLMARHMNGLSRNFQRGGRYQTFNLKR